MSDIVTGTAPRGRCVAVTFDDAFASVASLAKPVLDRLGWPGTVFAVTSFADSGRPLSWEGIDHWSSTRHRDELAGLDWSALRRLTDAGWEVGSHSVTHPHLTRCDDDQLADELSRSRAAMETAMGHACTSIAYPYGDVDARVIAAAGRAGYTVGASLPARWHAARPLDWPRVGVYRPDDLRRFRIKASPAVRLGRRVGDRAIRRHPPH